MRKYLVFLTVVAMGAGVLAGCGGDDDSNAGKSSTSAQANDGGDGNSDPTDVTTGNDEYDALLKKARTSSYRVTYRSSDSDGAFTISQDPPKSAFITADGTTYIRNGDDTVSCSGVGSSDAQCVSLNDAGAGVDALVTGFFGAYAGLLATAEDTNNAFFDVSTSNDEKIAGRRATCAELEAGALAGSGGRFKVCVDQETGVLLLGETAGGGDTSSIEAIEVGEPEASDFEPPVEPTDLGALPSVPGQ